MNKQANPVKGSANPVGFTGLRPWVRVLAIVPIFLLAFAALFAVKHGIANSQPRTGIVVGKNAEVVDPKDLVAQPKATTVARQDTASPSTHPRSSAPAPSAPNGVDPNDMGSGAAGVGSGPVADSGAGGSSLSTTAPALPPVAATPAPVSQAQLAHERQVEADRAAVEAPLVVSTIEPQTLGAPSTAAPVTLAGSGGYWLRPGMKIDATLYTSIDSTVPGIVVAYIPPDRPVWDFSHRVVVFPGGSKLVGSFGGSGFGISQGQARIAVTFSEIQIGDRVIELDAQPGIDRTGTSGFGARVDNHTRATFEAFTILAAAALLTKSSSCTNCEQSGSSSVGSTIVQAGVPLLPRPNLLPPTLHVSEGAQVAIMLRSEFHVQPWQP